MCVCSVVTTIWDPMERGMGFSRQEYWSGLPSPPPGALSDPGIKVVSLGSPELAGGFLTPSTPLGF